MNGAAGNVQVVRSVELSDHGLTICTYICCYSTKTLASDTERITLQHNFGAVYAE